MTMLQKDLDKMRALLRRAGLVEEADGMFSLKVGAHQVISALQFSALPRTELLRLISHVSDRMREQVWNRIAEMQNAIVRELTIDEMANAKAGSDCEPGCSPSQLCDSPKHLPHVS